MAIERYPDDDSCRRALRRDGFRQITFASNGDDEFWHNEEIGEVAEVARSKIFTYQRWTNAYQQIASRIHKERSAWGRAP